MKRPGASVWSLRGLKEHSVCFKRGYIAGGFSLSNLARTSSIWIHRVKPQPQKVAILSAVLLRRPEIYVRNSPLLPGQKLRGHFSSDGIPDSWLPLSADVEVPTLINTSRMVASSPVLACEGSVESEAVQLPFGGAQRWEVYRHPRPPDRSIS